MTDEVNNQFIDKDQKIFEQSNYNSNIKQPYVCKSCGQIKSAGRCVNKICNLYNKLK
jgi:hypothetical protein